MPKSPAMERCDVAELLCTMFNRPRVILVLLSRSDELVSVFAKKHLFMRGRKNNLKTQIGLSSFGQVFTKRTYLVHYMNVNSPYRIKCFGTFSACLFEIRYYLNWNRLQPSLEVLMGLSANNQCRFWKRLVEPLKLR